MKAVFHISHRIQLKMSMYFPKKGAVSEKIIQMKANRKSLLIALNLFVTEFWFLIKVCSFPNQDDDDEDGDLSKYQLDDDSDNENKDKGR